jgi:uncharacterized protein YbjT (DUF2867 family)
VPVRVALIAGASGLVGGHLLEQVLADPTWDRVVSVGRRELRVDDPRLEQRFVDFAAIEDLPQVTDAFCALGTTIRKAGSQEAFRAVDHDAVVALARAALTAGARTFAHVTALGADPGSRLFYNRVKGETERDVAAVGIPSTVAFRPSMLDGHREEPRPAEQAGLAMMRAVAPLLGKYRPTRAEHVAAAMLRAAHEERAGVRVVEAAEITRAGDGSGGG